MLDSYLHMEVRLPRMAANHTTRTTSQVRVVCFLAA
jgi:hypothetical protein